MEGKSQSKPLTTDVPRFARGLSILLIHNDTRTLVNLKTLLEKYSFKVTATSNTPTAASMILEDKGRFKMIMTKLNMPGVDAVSFVHLVLGKRIPVIFMYSGGFDDVTDEKALASESCYFIEEPIMLCDLKCILQDMYQSSKLIYKESQDITAEGSPQPRAQHANDTEVDGEIRNHGKGKGKVDHNKKMGGDSLVGAREGLHRSQGGGRVCEHSTYPTRPPSWLWKHSVPQMNLFSQNFRDSLFGDKKRLWTPELHLKFEEAVRHLGENARPKAILYMMNDASLTIRQVASHYQKYKSRMKHTENDSRKSDSGAVKTSSCSSVKAKFRSPPEGSSTGSAQGVSLPAAAESEIVNAAGNPGEVVSNGGDSEWTTVTVVRKEEQPANDDDELERLRVIKMLGEVDSETFGDWFENGIIPPPYEMDEYTANLKNVLDSLTPPDF